MAERNERGSILIGEDMYSLVDGKVIDGGKIAVQHVSSNPTNLMIGKTPYIFTPRHNVSLSWVLPEHLDKMLSVKGKGT